MTPRRCLLAALALLAASVCLPNAPALQAQTTSFSPVGLPSSRSPSPVFNRYASLPPFTAQQPRKGEWILVPTVEIAQCMTSYEDAGTGEIRAALDYETIAVELPISYGLTDGVSLEVDIQVQYLWGGFLDGVIEGYHDLFGFPNAGREHIERGQVTVDVNTENGYLLRLSEAALLVSDPVLGAAFALARGPKLDLTARAMAALPLGLGRGLSGADMPQLGAGLYADWRAARRVSAHLAAGGVLPLESLDGTGPQPYPMAHLRASALVELGSRAFLFIDLNLKTSPIRGDLLDGDRDLFHEPNADLLIGLVFSSPALRASGRFASFSVQEDPFSHNASDIRFLGTGAFRF